MVSVVSVVVLPSTTPPLRSKQHSLFQFTLSRDRCDRACIPTRGG